MGNIDLAQMDSEPDGRVFERLAYAKEGCTNLKNLIRQFIIFSKGGTANREIGSIEELIKDSAIRVIKSPNVISDLFMETDLWTVAYDKVQMKQVIGNLISNASESMPSGGQIKIYAENITAAVARKEAGLPMEEGDYVKISVQDKGTGIREEHLGRIFDPYFSTKKKGRGLGLTTVYSIIKKHYGYIYADSKPGAGTTFYLYLPASKKEIPRKQETKAAKPVLHKGKILIMDDEEIIIDVAVQMLSQLGYDVKFSKNGTQAIETYKKAMISGKPFDVVILDLHVEGGMGGKEAIRELLKIDPDVKGIVSSGYSNDPEMADFEKHGFTGIVEKPYSIQELGQTLENIMRIADF